MGKLFLLLVITSPMSSANALIVEFDGSASWSWQRSMSMHNTKSVGDSGYPCLTPDFNSNDGYNPLSSTNW